MKAKWYRFGKKKHHFYEGKNISYFHFSPLAKNPEKIKLSTF